MSELHLFQKGEIFDSETQEFEQKLLQKFNIDQSTTHVLKKEQPRLVFIVDSSPFFLLRRGRSRSTFDGRS